MPYPEQPEGGWFTTLLSWLVPVALIVGLWSLLTRRLLTAFGMSEQLAPCTVEQGPQPMFLSNGTRLLQTYSEAIARAIEREARGIVEAMAQRARQLIAASHGTPETLAQYLLVHKTIDQSTFARLLAGLQPTMKREPVAL